MTLIPTAPYSINPQAGLLNGARFVPSPNCDEREVHPIQGIDLVVVHNISLPPNEFGGDGVEALFTNRLDPNEHPYYQTIHQLKVSAHVFIRRDGEVVQFVPFHKRAWHAGVSCYEGREKCNDFSIGIELEGTDDMPFEPIQYDALNAVLDALVRAYPNVTKNNITGHSDIAPERKTDPGPYFDWSKIKR